MKRYIHFENGQTHTFELFGFNHSNGTFVYCIDDKYMHETKGYFRHERTWDDHLGNTPCGYYVLAPLPDGQRKRIYVYG